ncbi:hypothetical protein KYC5002_07425 [Archangium violaceum]|uniref:hypothetical protein n=1 Tax=Archangium violaceum TaxID=83451 RepID=UPI002B2F4057|nr:hypothetical protein KYC5002_07425 [Archangium gephyra]
MPKWADYLVVGVKYDATNTSIIKLQIKEDLGETTGPLQTASMEWVAQSILSGKTFVTAVLGTNNNYQQGAPVELSLRTRRDKSTADNLENLPRF